MADQASALKPSTQDNPNSSAFIMAVVAAIVACTCFMCTCCLAAAIYAYAGHQRILQRQRQKTLPTWPQWQLPPTPFLPPPKAGQGSESVIPSPYPIQSLPTPMTSTRGGINRLPPIPGRSTPSTATPARKLPSTLFPAALPLPASLSGAASMASTVPTQPLPPSMHSVPGCITRLPPISGRSGHTLGKSCRTHQCGQLLWSEKSFHWWRPLL